MHQLDGLRAFAVTAVAISHWTPNFLAGIVPWGTGVQLFFVLSGFLITGILLRSRPADSGASLGATLRAFYARRALRIFPVYYAVLLVALLLGIGPIKELWPWLATYLANFHYALHGHGPALADPFLHFWSLAVEEQFYLVWPFVVLLIARRSLLVVLIGALLVSVVFRLSIDRLFPSLESIRYLTPSCLDAFAAGGLVAYAQHQGAPGAIRRMGWWLAGVGFFGLVVTVLILPGWLSREAAHRIGHTFLVIFYGGIVAGAACGFPGWLGRVLAWTPVVYLGRVSYGVYVYHYFAPVAFSGLCAGLGVEVPGLPVMLAGYTAFTLLLSVISWHAFEVPLNRLKRRFPYPRSNDKIPVPAAAAVGGLAATVD